LILTSYSSTGETHVCGYHARAWLPKALILLEEIR
jgi:hypothetical protein